MVGRLPPGAEWDVGMIAPVGGKVTARRVGMKLRKIMDLELKHVLQHRPFIDARDVDGEAVDHAG
jgi:hypothetical protein